MVKPVKQSQSAKMHPQVQLTEASKMKETANRVGKLLHKSASEPLTQKPHSFEAGLDGKTTACAEKIFHEKIG